VAGNKAGLWSDFAEGGASGDLIDLWCCVKGCELPKALDEIRAWLGMEAPRFEKPDRAYRKPSPPKGNKPIGPVFKYLTETRKVSPGTLTKYRIGESGREIVFQSLVDGKPLFVKYLSIDRSADGKKITRVEPDCEPVLFGWQAIEPNAREITITEGEIDALSSDDYGFPAVSVPFGGGKGNKQRWIESEFDRLQRFETIYLALDDDAEGDAAVAEIVPRLGRHRCRRVRLPRKDMNQCRIEGVTDEEIRRCFAEAKTMDPAELRRAGEFTDDVISLFWPKNGSEPGYRLPFEMVKDRVAFRPAEMSIWTGPTGAGKSQILSYACVGFIEQGARLCIASFEMAARQLLRRMVKQAANVDRPTEGYIRACMDWLNEATWIFDRVGKSDISKMLEVFEYARARYGCDTFIVDSLMRLGIGSEDYEGQEKAVYQIVEWAIANNVHVHLVAHARKAGDKFKGVPETEDVKGAQEIGANAFNIIGVWRNRELEDQVKDLSYKVEHGDGAAREKLKEVGDRPPVIMNIAKQRNGDWEGKCGLWFNQATYQYRSSRDSHNGRSFVAYSNVEDRAA
jgi:twinkle protein